MVYTVADTPEGQRIIKAEEKIEKMLNDPNLTPEIEENLKNCLCRLDLLIDRLIEHHGEPPTLSQD